MAKKNQGFVYGAFILMLSNLVVKVVGALFKIPLANVIGDTAMGYYSSAYSVYSMLFLISTAGLPVAISRMIASARAQGKAGEMRRIFRASLGLFLVIGLASSLLLYFLAQQIAAIPQEPELALCFKTIAPILFFICLSSCIRGYFQGSQNMVPTAVSQVIEALGNLGVGLTLGVWAAKKGRAPAEVASFVLVGITVGVIASAVYLSFAKMLSAREEIPEAKEKSERRTRDVVRELIAIAVPITIASSVLSLTSVIDSMVAVRRMKEIELGRHIDFSSIQSMLFSLRAVAAPVEENTAAVSIYGAYTAKAVTLFNMPPTLIYPFAISIIPAISAAKSRADRADLHRTMDFTFRIVSLICLPAAVGLSVLSGPIIRLLFSTNETLYTDARGIAVTSNEIAAPMLSILATAILFSGLISVSGAMLQGYGFERKSIFSTCCGVFTKLVSSWVLIGIPAIGAFGIPISTLLCYAVMFFFNMTFLAKHTHYVFSIRKVLLKPLLAAAGCGVTAALSFWLLSSRVGEKPATILAILLAAVVYVLLIFAIKGIEKEEILMLPKGEKLLSLSQKLRLLRA